MDFQHWQYDIYIKNGFSQCDSSKVDGLLSLSPSPPRIPSVKCNIVLSLMVDPAIRYCMIHSFMKRVVRYSFSCKEEKKDENPAEPRDVINEDYEAAYTHHAI